APPVRGRARRPAPARPGHARHERSGGRRPGLPRVRALAAQGLRVNTRAARWVILLVPASLYLFSWVHRVAPAVVAADLMRAFSITAAALGNLAAIYPYVFAAMALVAGSLADTLGPRWTIALGGVTIDRKSTRLNSSH